MNFERPCLVVSTDFDQSVLMVRCLRPHNIRVGGVARTIKGAHAVPIERVARQSCVREGRDVCPYLSNLGKVGAIIPRAAFDLETGFV